MDQLITKYLAEQASPDERQTLEVWRNAKPENEAHFQQMAQAWQASGFQESAFTPNIEAALSNVHLQLTDNNPQKIRRLRTWTIGIAASIVLLAGMGYLLTQYTEDQWETVTMATHQSGEITLPDGSTVSLRGGSQLRYPAQFTSEKREVELEGEAFFEVAKDSARPFTILTDEVMTQVLGTSFLVKSNPEDNIVQVSVVTGKVAFYPQKAPEKQIFLTPNQRGIYAKSSQDVISQEYDNPNLLAWKTHQLIFEDRNLGEVVEELSDYFGKKIRLADEKAASCSLTTSYDHPELADVLKELEMIFDLTADIQAETVMLSGTACALP